MAETPEGAGCQACNLQFALKPGGALDLRLTRPRKVSFEFELGSALDLDGVDLLPLKEKPDSRLVRSLAGVPWHLSRELLSYRPEATAPWTVLQAQADMALFPKMPGWLRSALIAPLQLAHRLWWSAGAAMGKVDNPAKRILQTSGMFAFIAKKTASWPD